MRVRTHIDRDEHTVGEFAFDRKDFGELTPVGRSALLGLEVGPLPGGQASIISRRDSFGVDDDYPVILTIRMNVPGDCRKQMLDVLGPVPQVHEAAKLELAASTDQINSVGMGK